MDLKDDDLVVEIGSGHGELTREIIAVNQSLRMVLIEKDKELAKALERTFSDDKRIKIITDDALKTIPLLVEDANLKNRGYKVAGNIPYYITGQLMRVLGELKNKPELSVFTVQKEVGERLVAVPPKMNLLSASVQFWGVPEILGTIQKKEFSPQPKVDSAIVRIKTRNRNLGRKDDYYRLIKAIFRQPRQTILNNLSRAGKFEKKELKILLGGENIGSLERPQSLSVREIVKLIELMRKTVKN